MGRETSTDKHYGVLRSLCFASGTHPGSGLPSALLENDTKYIPGVLHREQSIFSNRYKAAHGAAANSYSVDRR